MQLKARNTSPKLANGWPRIASYGLPAREPPASRAQHCCPA